MPPTPSWGQLLGFSKDYLRIAPHQNASGEPPRDDLPSRILQLLSSTPEPLTVGTLRSRLQVRNQRVIQTLHHLAAQGKVQRHARGFSASQQIQLSS